MSSRLYSVISGFTIAVLFCAGFVSCNQDEHGGQAFSLSAGTSLAVGALSNADTTLKVVLRSPLEWTLQSAPEWITLTPDASQGSPMLVSVTIARNEGIDTRTGDLLFRLTDGSTYAIPCVQFSAAGGMALTGKSVFEFDYTAQSENTTVVSNLHELTAEVLPATEGTWLTTTLTPGQEAFHYTCAVSVTGENQTGDVRTARIVIRGRDNDGSEMTATLYVTQDYLMETLTSSHTNDATGFTFSWGASSLPAATCYVLEITDGAASPTVIASYDVTNQNSCLIDTIAVLKNYSYFGNISVTVAAKVSAEATKLLGKTVAYATLSHFADPAGGIVSDGMDGTPYLINCARHFNNIAALQTALPTRKLLEKFYRQTADITFPDPTNPGNLGGNVAMAGSKASPFLGVYDGGSKKFENVYIISDAAYTGIFGQLGTSGATSTAVIKNMNVYVNYIEARAANFGTTDGKALAVGGIVGMNAGTVEYCTVQRHGTAGAIYENNRNGTAAMDYSQYIGHAGGIAGANERIIDHCVNKDCPVVSRFVAGGITGGITTSPVVVTNIASYTRYCYNLADVFQGNPGPGVTLPMGIVIEASTTLTDEFAASGIVGNATGQGGSYRHNVEYCFNGGRIYSEKCAAGILGRVHFCNTTKCYNYGAVTVVRNIESTDARYVCGIQSWANANQNSIAVCYNVGTLNYYDVTDTGATIYVGGCVGGKGGNNTNSTLADLVYVNQTTPVALTGLGVCGWTNGSMSGITTATCLGRTDAQMKSLSNYTPAFTTTDWVFSTGYDYPQLAALPMP